MSYRVAVLFLMLTVPVNAQLSGADRFTFSDLAFQTCYQKLERELVGKQAMSAMMRGRYCLCFVNNVADHVSLDDIRLAGELQAKGHGEAVKALMAPFVDASDTKCIAELVR